MRTMAAVVKFGHKPKPSLYERAAAVGRRDVGKNRKCRGAREQRHDQEGRRSDYVPSASDCPGSCAASWRPSATGGDRRASPERA